MKLDKPNLLSVEQQVLPEHQASLTKAFAGKW